MALQESMVVLHFLVVAEPKYVNAILNVPNTNLIQALTEICYNIEKGNLNLTKGDKTDLKTYHLPINTVASTKENKKKKLKAIKKAGFLNKILTTFLSKLY